MLYEAANARGFSVFAVQNGGWCASSLLAAQTFDKYGNSSDCKSDGEGGPWANQVYLITSKLMVTFSTIRRNKMSHFYVLKIN